MKASVGKHHFLEIGGVGEGVRQEGVRKKMEEGKAGKVQKKGEEWQGEREIHEWIPIMQRCPGNGKHKYSVLHGSSLWRIS